VTFPTFIIKSTFRNRQRTLLTAVGVGVAIIAFLFLRTFIAAWYAGVDAAAQDRLVVRNKISLTFPLPLSYGTKIRAVPGVSDLGYSNWFGGVYIEEKNFFAQFATDAEAVFRIYPEYLVSDEQKRAFLEDRTGAMVGRLLADKYHWKVGDKVTIKGTIYPGDWTFTIRAIYDATQRAVDLQTFFFHWKYLNEQRPEGRRDQVGMYLLRVADPSRAAEVGRSIDQLFANSLAETRTESEKAFQLSFISMASALLVAIEAVSGVVLLILMLILGNTMAMATRERTTEYAVMRAIGFRPSHVVRMVVGEGFVVALLGVCLGVGLATPILGFFSDLFSRVVPGFLGEFHLNVRAVTLAALVSLAGGVTAAAIPAWRAARMRPVDGLRRVE
jgi:putative ABC transport system permease protein